ncbi:hypothetical protein CerSpe_065170 [Prunus speciosa]
MNPQLVANSSQTRSRSSNPKAHPNPRRNTPLEPSIIHSGRFTFTIENNETRVSTTALASSVQNHFESFCLVGKVFGVPIPGRAIRNRLRSDWKNLQDEVFVNHIGKDWYKIEFCSVEDVEYVMKNRPWFVQGQIFALQTWRPDFSPFHATVESIVCWARIPFLPLHYKDPKVLSDLVSILGTPISIDQSSMVSKQSMFVRVCLEVDLTKPLKRCLIFGEGPKETRIYISYEALFAICFYCSQKKELRHICPIKISNKNYLQVERLNNEPKFFPRDLVLDEEDQRKLQDDVILVFPQPITVEDIHKDENGEDGEDGYM